MTGRKISVRPSRPLRKKAGVHALQSSAHLPCYRTMGSCRVVFRGSLCLAYPFTKQVFPFHYWQRADRLLSIEATINREHIRTNRRRRAGVGYQRAKRKFTDHIHEYFPRHGLAYVDPSLPPAGFPVLSGLLGSNGKGATNILTLLSIAPRPNDPLPTRPSSPRASAPVPASWQLPRGSQCSANTAQRPL